LCIFLFTLNSIINFLAAISQIFTYPSEDPEIRRLGANKSQEFIVLLCDLGKESIILPKKLEKSPTWSLKSANSAAFSLVNSCVSSSN
jgi:hypothetical protein